LGREAIETGYVLKQILDAGVRVFYYLDDHERVLDTAMDKVMLTLVNFASEVEREKARQRTYDAMLRKAKNLYVTGGRVYGYDNKEILAETPGPDGRRQRVCVVRVINAEQAAIVRRIFQLCAGGKGLTRIAKTLNAERVAPSRQAKGWAPTAIREMLHRPLYKGEIVWNKTHKIMRGGTKKQVDRPETEWITIPAPDLQIVSNELWDAAHARMDQARKVFARVSSNGRLMGRPSRLDMESPYLLSGMGRCAVCGGAIIGMTRGQGQVRGRRYGCSYHHKRGAAICGNDVQMQQDVLDQALLSSLSDALDERLVAAAVERALEKLRSEHATQPDRRMAIEREISLIEAKERNLVAAVSRGDAVDPLLDALKAEGERKATLVRELTGLQEMEKVANIDSARVQRDLKAQAESVRGLLSKHVPQARQMLRKLVNGRLQVTPIERNGRKGFRFEGQGTYGKLLAGEAAMETTQEGSCATSHGVPSGIRWPLEGGDQGSGAWIVGE
jgi:site-specific DNA recombinase